jgi:uncharacterized metal-binding protein
MSDGCENNESRPTEASCCCRTGKGNTVLLYACGGGANVGEIADQAARDLMLAGEGTMFCLAGLGADIQGMVQTARDADWNVVIDGCDVDCAKKVFDRHGVTNYTQIKVTDLDIEKQKGVRRTQDQVNRVIARARTIVAEKRESK